jgi:hypothetical protein
MEELFSDLKKLLASWNLIGRSVLTEHLGLWHFMLELSTHSSRMLVASIYTVTDLYIRPHCVAVIYDF